MTLKYVIVACSLSVDFPSCFLLLSGHLNINISSSPSLKEVLQLPLITNSIVYGSTISFLLLHQGKVDVK